ncbi:hypothetical protein CDD82_1702 [Ophiocordyceps australis]|uniref:Prion-inhibition and propagation HeLo domain-containing protein n=1 Tax=Ophiocordyceps australis TaxID=1399860 RepID=A0A2C5Y8Q6_9HYPO|nr:hypothetical protein CDD82_1702 [Ophiocordyceps australis]
MDPQAALVQVAFHGAYFAIRTLRNSLSFSHAAERLILNLEIERFRLLIWGQNSGLTPPDSQPPRLPARLASISPIINQHLDGIAKLLRDAQVLRARYGLQETHAQPTSSATVRRLLERMQKTICAAGIRVDADGDVARGSGLDSPVKRLRWAVCDLDRFSALVEDLGSRISKLNQLLTEAQQARAHEDSERFNIVLVGSVADQEVLELVLAAVNKEPVVSATRARVENMAISANVPLPHVVATKLALADFALPDSWASMKRFLAAKKQHDGRVYLLERKDFDPNIGTREKRMLVSRIQHLVCLLSKPKTRENRTPVAEGCIHDAARFCWWMVHRLPGSSLFATQRISHEPVSLAALLHPDAKFRPRLEQRYTLASDICATLSELFSSSWLHKGIRSQNILFPVSHMPDASLTAAQSNELLKSMLICGFDYTRQESEQDTIDKARQSGAVATAMYRHPSYQGDAAAGYKLQYDVYSLGLVLVEIALWKPLHTFVQTRPKSSTHGPQTCPDPAIFHEPQAAALKRRLLHTVDAEFGFRVGSHYHHATKFCLEFADLDASAADDEFPTHPSLEFYNKVVVPLSRLEKGVSLD